MRERRRRAPARTTPLVWFLALCASCSVTGNSGAPDPAALLADPDRDWLEAQHDLAGLLPAVDGDPYQFSMGRFVIETESAPFYCGDTGLHAVLLVYGCFRAELGKETFGVIRYVPGNGALRHEARHAILFALGDSRWPDVGH